MANFFALIFSLCTFTGTVVAVNYFSAPNAPALSYDIRNALIDLAINYGANFGVPHPFHWGVGLILVILPALIIFWIVRAILE